MLKFRIYYDDGFVAGSIPVTLERKYGVICVLQQRDDGFFHMVSNGPYYLFVGESWLPAYENDVIDYLVNKPGAIKQCIVGRIVSKGAFQKIYGQAQEDRKKMD